MGDTPSQHQQEAIAAGATGPSPAGVPGGGVVGPLPPGAAVPGAVPWQQGTDEASIGGAQLCKLALLSQLVQLLGQRKGHSLLLSDLGALLPGNLRHGVKEKGGLRSWLQKYPELFQVSGQPGKESVTLLLGTGGDGSGASAAAATIPPGAMAETAAHDAAKCGNDADLELRKQQEDEENEAAVQLRGLPYRATVADIKAFLGRHAQTLKDEGSVQLVLNRDGRPSGFARVQFDSPATARLVRDDLHMKKMEAPGAKEAGPAVAATPGAIGAQAQNQGQERYVEIFLFSERPNKLRFKKIPVADGSTAKEDEEFEAMGVTKDQVAMECREHMASPGKGQLLLSMLGVALSQGARLYLKKTDQGLKHFLAQYPQEFSVDGAKGRECVSYLPALATGGQDNSDLPTSFPGDAQKKSIRQSNEGTGGPANGSISDLHRGLPPRWEEPALVPQSPKNIEVPSHLLGDTPKLISTPSDWGTPQQFAAQWDPRDRSLPAAHKHGSDVSGSHRPDAAGESRADANAASGPFGATNPAVAAAAFGNWPPWAMPPPAAYWPPPYWGLPGAGPLPPWGPPVPGQSAPGTEADHASALSPWAGDGMRDAAGALGAKPPPVPQGAEVELDNTAAVRLRGLPFTATELDVLGFFAKHDVVGRIAEGSQAVRMISKANGKPSGHAVVHMLSLADAYVAMQVLNGQYMGSRYIEVLHAEAEDPASRTSLLGPGHATASTTGGTGGGGAQPPAAAAQQKPPSPEAFSPFDGVSDTGGSGGAVVPGSLPFNAAMAAANMAAMTSWRSQPGLGGPHGYPMKPVDGQLPPEVALGARLEAQTATSRAGTGDGCSPPREDWETERSWEALCDFLKRDNLELPIPSAAASILHLICLEPQARSVQSPHTTWHWRGGLRTVNVSPHSSAASRDQDLGSPGYPSRPTAPSRPRWPRMGSPRWMGPTALLEEGRLPCPRAAVGSYGSVPGPHRAI